MVTKVEINGYEITIEEMEGVISVKAEKDEEIIEEFTIETEEGEEGEDVKGFGEFGDEEEDFGGEESQEEDEDELQGEEEDEDDNERPALESFQSFINKK